MKIAFLNTYSDDVDWVTEKRMSELTGKSKRSFQHFRARKTHPEGLVWKRVGRSIHYSKKGYNQWINAQNNNCRVE